MARPTHPAQTSFTAGEISPEMAARWEVTKYYSGAALMENVLVRPTGGYRRRPGFAHVAELDDAADGAIRLIPFAFNIEQTYLLVLTNGRFRVFLPNGTLVATVMGCPWTGAQARQINYVQSADTLLLFHHDIASQRIRRGGSHSSWTRDALPYANIPTFDYGAGAEAIISATRGWPECGCFHQGRLWVGGLRSRPSTLMGSVVGAYFDFSTGTLDDRGIVATVDSDQINAIHQIASGRGLQIFTAGSEHAELNSPITPGTIGIQQQTARGITRYMPIVEIDNAVLFAQRGGGGIREFLYQDIQQAFDANLLSRLCSHLMGQPRDMAARKRALGDDADHVIILNTPGAVRMLPDGSTEPACDAFVLTTLRQQEVTAFTRWNTAGHMWAVAALDGGEVFFAVLRDGSMRIERWDAQRLCDASVLITGGTVGSIPNQPHLVGLTCDLILDGVYAGQVVPDGGTIDLPFPVQRVEIGLHFDTDVISMPIEPRDVTGAVIGRLCRITRCTARLLESVPPTINGQPCRPWREGVADLLVPGDRPALYTGDVAVHGLRGWRERQQLRIRQPVPGPLTVLALAPRLIIGGDA